MVMPAIRRVWLEHQRWLIASLQSVLVFGGNGRSDSPGHSAMFGSYVITELGVKATIDMQLAKLALPGHSYYCDTGRNAW